MHGIFTDSEYEIIKDNLNAFKQNFGLPRIEREDANSGFYVFLDGSSVWTQYCYNLDYLNGWLIGCVQTAHNRVAFDPELFAQYISGGKEEHYALDHYEKEVKMIDGHVCYVYSDHTTEAGKKVSIYDTVDAKWLSLNKALKVDAF